MIYQLIVAAAASQPAPMGLIETLERYGTLILGGGFFLFAGTVVTVLATRRKNRMDDLQGRFTSATELDEYIDGRIERVAQPLRDKITKLENRELSTKTILYAFFQRLMWWDERGRTGVMPMPAADDLTTLGLDLADLTNTQDHDTVREAVRRMHDRQGADGNVTDIHPQQNGTTA